MYGLEGTFSFLKSWSSRVHHTPPNLDDLCTRTSFQNQNYVISVLDKPGDSSFTYSGNDLDIAVSGRIYLNHKLVGKDQVVPLVRSYWKANNEIELCKFDGTYLMFIFDKTKQILRVVIDENTIIPFYYHVDNSTLYFSWNIAYVIANMKTVQADYLNISSWLIFGGIGFNDSTIFLSINRLERGSILEF